MLSLSILKNREENVDIAIFEMVCQCAMDDWSNERSEKVPYFTKINKFLLQHADGPMNGESV